MSCLLYGALTRALHELLKLSFLFLFRQVPSLVSANTPSLKADPQLCISSLCLATLLSLSANSSLSKPCLSRLRLLPIASTLYHAPRCPERDQLHKDWTLYSQCTFASKTHKTVITSNIPSQSEETVLVWASLPHLLQVRERKSTPSREARQRR